MSRRISFRPLIFLVLCLLVVMYLARTMSRQGDITYSAMRENFVQEKVQSFTVSDSRLTAAALSLYDTLRRPPLPAPSGTLRCSTTI